ncbi:MAG: hypothetical protein ACRD8Z_18910 [Nitrososphaeraceae archaeon]
MLHITHNSRAGVPIECCISSTIESILLKWTMASKQIDGFQSLKSVVKDGAILGGANNNE